MAGGPLFRTRFASFRPSCRLARCGWESSALFLAALGVLDWLLSRRSLESLRLTFPAEIHAILGEAVSLHQ